MSSENNQSNILSSWKEISAYLKCGVRTCMRYEEKYGLPVYRLEEKPKTHVFAYKNELDKWLRDKSNIDSFKARSTNRNKKILIKTLFFMGSILIMAVFTFVFIITCVCSSRHVCSAIVSIFMKIDALHSRTTDRSIRV